MAAAKLSGCLRPGPSCGSAAQQRPGRLRSGPSHPPPPRAGGPTQQNGESNNAEERQPRCVLGLPKRLEKRKQGHEIITARLLHTVGNVEANARIPGVCRRGGSKMLTRESRIYNVTSDHAASHPGSQPRAPSAPKIKPLGLTFKALHGHEPLSSPLLPCSGQTFLIVHRPLCAPPPTLCH